MAAPVVVQGLPPEADLRSSALGACSDALEPRACVAAEEHAVPSEEAATVARVTWPDGDLRHVRVALRRQDHTSGGALSRETQFSDDDPILERWRAVGLVIAALVGESNEPAIERASDRMHPPSRPPPDEIATGWVGVSGLLGPGLDDGSFRAGAAIVGAKAIERLPFFLSASASYAIRPVDGRGIHLNWTTVGAGGGVSTSLSRLDLGLRVRLEVMLEYLRAEIDRPDVVAGGGERLSPGLRGGIDAVWPASGSVGLTAAFSAWTLTGGTAIEVDQRRVGSSAWLSYAGMLGGQFSFR